MKTPLEYYKLIALLALNYIESNFQTPGALSLLRTAYIDFLSVIMHCIENNLQPTYEMMTDSELINVLRKKPWTEYHTNVG